MTSRRHVMTFRGQAWLNIVQCTLANAFVKEMVVLALLVTKISLILCFGGWI